MGADSSQIDAMAAALAADPTHAALVISYSGLGPNLATILPILQERGVFRTEYAGSTLRDHLGLAVLQARPRRAAEGRLVAS